MSVIQSHAAHTCSRVWDHTYKICIRLKIQKEKKDQKILVRMSYVIVEFTYKVCYIDVKYWLMKEYTIYLFVRRDIARYFLDSYALCVEMQNKT